MTKKFNACIANLKLEEVLLVLLASVALLSMLDPLKPLLLLDMAQAISSEA
jgi:hypothetical protein